MSDAISKQALLDIIEITPFEDYGDYITVRELIEKFQTIENELQSSKIIEAYSQGFKDGADAVKKIAEQTEPQTDCAWK